MPRVKKHIWTLVETDEWVDVPDDLPGPVELSATRPPASPGRYPLLDDKGVQVGWSDDEVRPPEYVEKFDTDLTRSMPREFKPRAKEDPALAVLDNPIIGGRLTVCVLGYGFHRPLMERCLGGILKHAGTGRLDVRVALNSPSPETVDYVAGFDKSLVTKIYVRLGESAKYPAMREMFWDESCPIETKYVLWFDDDSHVVDDRWLSMLGQAIVKNHLQGCRLYGAKYVHDLMPYRGDGYSPEKWFKEGGWWRDAWMHMKSGERLAPNGHQIVFASGGFWALGVDALRAADVPDKRLAHNGGDITIGEQVHQAGFKVCDFARNKTPVRWSDAPPRGDSHKGPGPKEFPWSKYL